MADEKKTFDPNEEIPAGEDMSLDDLLSRLRDEHGMELGQKDSAEKKSKKPDSDFDSELDGFEFDNRPIEADYMNYNIMSRGKSEKEEEEEEEEADSAPKGDASHSRDDAEPTPPALSEDTEADTEDESLPWDDDEVEVKEAPKQEDAVYRNMRERYLRQRGLWQDDADEDGDFEEEETVTPDQAVSESPEEAHIYNKEEMIPEEVESEPEA